MGIKGVLCGAMGLGFFFISPTSEAKVTRCSDFISGLDGDLLWMQDFKMGSFATAPNSNIVVVADGSFIKGLNLLDGRVRWDLNVEQHFSIAQFPALRRDGNRLYLIGVKKIIELDAQSGEVVATIDTPFMRAPVEHDIEMGLMFQHRGPYIDAARKQLAKDQIEQMATDRSLSILDDWFIIRDEGGVKFLNRKGGGWRQKSLPGFIAAQGLNRAPGIYEDKDQFITWAYSGPSKVARLEAYGFDFQHRNFIRRWALNLNDPLENITDFLSTEDTLYVMLTVPTGKDDGIRAKRLVAIDRKSGEQLWSKNSNSRTWQDHSLIASKNILMTVVDDEVIGRNASTGEKIWDFGIRPTPNVSDKIKIQWLNERQIIAIRGKKAFILDAKTGRLEADIAISPIQEAPFDPNLIVLDSQHVLVSSVGGSQDKLGLVRLK